MAPPPFPPPCRQDTPVLMLSCVFSAVVFWTFEPGLLAAGVSLLALIGFVMVLRIRHQENDEYRAARAAYEKSVGGQSG